MKGVNHERSRNHGRLDAFENRQRWAEAIGRYAVKTLREYARSCRRFDRFCGLEIRARDVTVQYLDEFLAWQLSQGYPAKDARKQVQTISTVVRHADDKLLPRWAPRVRDTDGAANEGIATTEWPLVRVINDIIKPTGKRSQRTIVKYRQACRRSCRFRGSPQRVSDVTVALIEQFVEWQIKNGYSEGTARDAGDHLAAVVRCADRERLPMKYRRSGSATSLRPAFDDADVDASLESIMINVYFPTRSTINDPKTEKQYAFSVSKFSKFLGHPASLADLDDLAFGRWMRAMKQQGLAPITINGYMNKLRAFWTWAAKRKLVEMFPTIENVPEPQQLPEAYPQDQMHLLVAACSLMPGEIHGVKASAWWEALHRVAFDSAERCSAMLNLKWRNYDAGDAMLEAPASIRKGGRKPKLYRLKAATVAVLESIRSPKRELIFPPIGKNNCSYHGHYRKLLKLAGLPYVPHKSGLQKVRRTFASHLEAAGGNATAALGHTARRVTEQSYLDPRIVKEAVHNELLFDL